MDKFISVNIDPTSREDHSVLSAVNLNWANSSQSTKVTRVSSIPDKNTFFLQWMPPNWDAQKFAKNGCSVAKQKARSKVSR